MNVTFVAKLPPGGPRSERGERAWVEEAKALRNRPGDWARITEKSTVFGATQMASYIRRGHLLAFRPAGRYEATHRGTVVYARYVGGDAL